MSKIPALALSIAALGVALSACGGSSSSSTASSSSSSAPASSTSSAASTSAPATSSSQTSAAAGGGVIAIGADPGGALKFTKPSLTAKAGKVTIQFTNGSPIGHNITIQQGTSGSVLGATPTFQGGTKTLSLTLKAGTYTFYCSVPGHRAGGMQGTLTVS
jgi:plastocyanin